MISAEHSKEMISLSINDFINSQRNITINLKSFKEKNPLLLREGKGIFLKQSL